MFALTVERNFTTVLQSAQCTLRYAHYTMHSRLCTLCYALYAIHTLQYTQCYAIYVMHSMLCTLCFALAAIHSYVMHFMFWARWYALYVLHSMLFNLCYAVYAKRGARKQKWGTQNLHDFMLQSGAQFGQYAFLKGPTRGPTRRRRRAPTGGANNGQLFFTRPLSANSPSNTTSALKALLKRTWAISALTRAGSGSSRGCWPCIVC